MNIRAAFQSGLRDAFARYKIAANMSMTSTGISPGGGPTNNSQSPAVAMSMAIPKPSTPTTAPVAPGAAKASVL